MKLSKLLPGIILPFLMFALVGGFCPGDEEEPKPGCTETRDSWIKLIRVNDQSLNNFEIKTPNARAECSASFEVVFGYEDIDMFQSDLWPSPIENSLVGLKLKFGETRYHNTYIVQSISKENGRKNPDNISGYAWVIEFSVDAPSTSGETQFYVELEHDYVGDGYDFWVDVNIKYSYVQ